MRKKKKLCVVIPAYNVGLLVVRVLDGLPDFIDRAAVVDDASSDDTAARVAAYRGRFKGEVTLIRLPKNAGLDLRYRESGSSREAREVSQWTCPVIVS